MIVEARIENRVGYLTMNRPEKRNALSPESIKALTEQLVKWKEDSSVKVVVLTGRGKAFCAGADLSYLESLQTFSYQKNLEDTHLLRQLFNMIYTYPKPVIAALNGHAIAGGAGLAAVCDYIIAAKEIKTGFTEVRIGFIPALVMVFLVRKIGESFTRRLLIRGDLISAKEALRIGLIHEVADADLLENRVRELAEELVVSNSAESMAQTKSLLVKVQELSLADGLESAEKQNAASRLTKDCKKGIATFLNKDKLIW